MSTTDAQRDRRLAGSLALPMIPTRLFAIGLIVLVGFLLSLKLVGLAYREIYPAVIFPGFARLPETTPQTEEEVRIRKVNIKAGDRELELAPDEAFPGPLRSFYLSMLESLADAEPSPSLQAWATETWRSHNGDRPCVTGLQVVEVAVIDETDREIVSDLSFAPCPGAPEDE